jgi:hypothetical protein
MVILGCRPVHEHVVDGPRLDEAEKLRFIAYDARRTALLR